MPKEDKMVDLDTSGEGAEINLEEKEQHETVVEDNSSPMTHLRNLVSSWMYKKAKNKKK